MMEALKTGQPRTRHEIHWLKTSWKADRYSWDFNIEDTPGFEAHRDELHLFRLEQDMLAEQEWNARMHQLADDIGCPGNIKLAEAWHRMTRRIEGLEGE